MSNTTFKTENGPNAINQNRPINILDHGYGLGKQISPNLLEELALEKYKKNGKGITIKDLIQKFGVHKNKAQRRLKNAIKEKKDKPGILFTLNRKNPQQYYPTRLKAEIIEQIKKQNRLINPTGVSLYQNPYLENIKARYVSELLTLLQNKPLSIHKVHLKISIDKNYYKEIKIEQVTEGNKSKSHETNIGHRNVKYQAYPDVLL